MANNNWAFVTAAYAVTWVVILAYLRFVHRALRQARAAYARATAQSPGTGS